MTSQKPGHSGLELNPGVTVQRRSVSGCKCLLWTGAIFTVVSIAVAVAGFFSAHLDRIRNPHPQLYENKTVEEVKNWNAVVQPLIDENQLFDIFATVWARVPNGEGGDGAISTMIDDKDPSATITEVPIYANTVFSGVTLKDEHVFTDVNLQIPLKGFTSLEALTNHDLRASFVLIPQSPSLLDRLVNYSSWRPESLTFLPNRFYKNNLEDSTISIPDQAIDSFGISTPLLDFHSVRSSCSPSNSTEPKEIDLASEAGNYEGDSDDTAVDGSDLEDRVSIMTGFVSTKGRPASQYHPYVITRTQLRVIRMTKLYNWRAYDKFHRSLRNTKTGCGAFLRPLGKDGRTCFRAFDSRANAETRFLLAPAEGTTRPRRVEWAYAPFMHVTRRGWGPLDLVAMPINRENCSSSLRNPSHGSQSLAIHDPESLNVTWRVSYSGTTAEKIMIGDIFASIPSLNMSDTEYKKAEKHQAVVFAQRLHGHKFKSDHHSGRLFIAGALAILSLNLQRVFDTHYWYTRTTTVGISVFGTALQAVFLLLLYVSDIWINEIGDKATVMSLIWKVVTSFPLCALPPLAMIKAVLRLELGWWKGTYLPIIRAMPASHTERASMRLETRKENYWMMLGIIASTIAFHNFSSLREYPIFSALGPDRDVEALSGTKALFSKLKNGLFTPAIAAGRIYQIVLNHRTRTFAGRYKFSVVLEAVQDFVGLAPFISLLFGTLELRDKYCLVDLFYAFLMLASLYQACKLRPVPQVTEDKYGE